MNINNDPIINQTINQPPPNYTITPTFEPCSQCGTFHPPLQPGQECPLAPIKTKDNKSVDINKFLTMLKTILNSQVSKKNIKDPEKLIKLLIIEVTKYLENYEEGEE